MTLYLFIVAVRKEEVIGIRTKFPTKVPVSIINLVEHFKCWPVEIHGEGSCNQPVYDPLKLGKNNFFCFES